MIAMPTIIEVNVQTGETIEREMTPQEIADLPAPEPVVEAPVVVDPTEKLKTFLAANPDLVAFLLNQ